MELLAGKMHFRAPIAEDLQHSPEHILMYPGPQSAAHNNNNKNKGEGAGWGRIGKWLLCTELSAPSHFYLVSVMRFYPSPLKKERKKNLRKTESMFLLHEILPHVTVIELSLYKSSFEMRVLSCWCCCCCWWWWWWWWLWCKWPLCCMIRTLRIQLIIWFEETVKPMIGYFVRCHRCDCFEWVDIRYAANAHILLL